jgi:hypothetical protein
MTNDELMTKHECLKRGPIRPSSLVIPSSFVIRIFSFSAQTPRLCDGCGTGGASSCEPNSRNWRRGALPSNTSKSLTGLVFDSSRTSDLSPSHQNESSRISSGFVINSSFVIRASSFFYAPRIRETCGKDSTRAAISDGSPFLICSTEIALATSNRPDFTRRNA